MGQETNHRTDDEFEISLSRRAFTATVGGAAALAAATDPVAADDLRGTPRRMAAGMQTIDSIDSSFTPSEWSVVGPFQYQRRNVEIGWLFPEGSETAFYSGEKVPKPDQRFQAAFAGGATVTWAERTADKGTVSLDFSDRIDPTDGKLTPLVGASGLFDDYQDWFGIGGVLFSMGYAFTTIEMDQPQRAVLETDATTLWLNGQRYEEPPVGVTLQEGTNYLLAKQILTLGSGSVSVSFRPPRAPVEINPLDAFRGTPQNVILPDLKAGEQTDRPASVRVTNTTSEPIDGATLTFAPDSDLLIEQHEKIDPPLAPFETRRINTRVKTKGPVTPKARATIQSQQTETVSGLAMATTFLGENALDTPQTQQTGGRTLTIQAANSKVVARVTVDEDTDDRTIPLRIRQPDEKIRQTTFTSEIDGSVQEFSIHEPTNPTAEGSFELAVSLHGAGVNSINQAAAYITRDDLYVLAPGTRGPSAYDHEDLGRLDDLEAIRVMKERYNIDDNNVYLTGHSMGGHGTWHVGLTNPDHFAGLAPSASWTDHETYITMTFGRDTLWTHPRIKAVKDAALYQTRALPKTENAADGTLPTFVLHGGEDTSVPTLLPRTYARTLANLNLRTQGEVGRQYSTPSPDAVDVAYLEVPGQGHWWDAGIGPGADCVNHPDLFTFLRATERDPYPERLRFYTSNLRIEHQKFWVSVLEQHTVHAPTRVIAEVTDEGIKLETENVALLAIDPQVLSESSVNAPLRLHAAGETARLPKTGAGQSVVVDLRDGIHVSRQQVSTPGREPLDDEEEENDWDDEEEGEEDGDDDDPGHEPPDDPRRGPPGRSHLHKTPNQYGPLQEAQYSPYRLVYGTQGSDMETNVNRNLANIRSQRLVERARAPAIVIPDTMVDENLMRQYNLVLFGQPSSNAILHELQSEVPIQVSDGEVSITGQTYTGDLGVEYIYPNPAAPDRLVQVETGTSVAGVRLTRVQNWIPTWTGTGDYQIFDNTIRYQRWNACLAAGFFDKHWEVSPELGVLRRTI